MAATSLNSRPHASVYNVPAFASGLGMTLEPIKTAAAAGAGATNATTTTTAVTLEKVSKREIFQDLLPSSFASLLSKIQQTKILVTCQSFGDLFLFGLIWQYSSNHKTYNKGRSKVIATYLQQ